ncbi:Kelch repeat-containing protein [Thermobaculum terrenum ATCC BAA-798]|uniref:Kelch repeat-containing protein n=1 Tax=Thermobaculum terrenum (strain ATCC BAA-798 / CCMEE 7001 / YNP1) TaxID=525904 RepID=D1CIU2_THET1|nr:Ig-like domain-containing protein [Thermobaculum terrenum]ACZ43662.1 Kelch repeat-containing protein [Thermobaculum terrenum ATCC BAA-798]
MKVLRSLIVALIILTSGLAPYVMSSHSYAAGNKPTETLGVRASSPALFFGHRGDRRRSAPLEEGSVLSGKVYVFAQARNVNRAYFFLDVPSRSSDLVPWGVRPLRVDARPPYDLVGDNGNKALPLDTSKLANGTHTITAAFEGKDGSVQTMTKSFVVYNGPRALLITPQRISLELPKGGKTSIPLNVLSSDNRPVRYSLSKSVDWMRLEPAFPDPQRLRGKAPQERVISLNAGKLAPGNYRATLRATAPGYRAGEVSIELTVTKGNASSRQIKALQASTQAVTSSSSCYPLDCSQILVELPYNLDFSGDEGKILDKNGVGTGFTYVDQPSKGTGYIPQNLTVDTSGTGTLNILTTKGINSGTANSQDNALGVGIDAPSQISVLKTTVINPPLGSGNYEQAGLWFGNNEDNYLKLGVLSTPKGLRIQYLIEVGGTTQSSKTTSAMSLANAKITFTLRANPGDQTVKAYYQINNNSQVLFGTFTAPAEFFSFDAAGIDPRIGTRSFGGIYATHRKGPSPLTYKFDDFSVTADGIGSPPDSNLTFDRVSFPVPFPTSMVWGPDNRLYVTELLGKIHAITLDDDKHVVSDQVITTLGSRLTLGITVDPASTPDNVILWVSHSSPDLNNGVLNSSMVTKLWGPGFTNRQDVITGLPRAIANHAVNSIHFGPDGKLYIAQGGNTGAGAPNTANTEFGTRAEQPLSAAFLVADVKAPGFDGTCATPENTYGPSPCDVFLYSSGLRNMYDFTFHSNGSIYGPDNGLGVVGTYPPSPTPPCEGFGNPQTNNPGEQPDNLQRLLPGKYYGHPNPYRNECVFKDGSYQGVAPLPNYAQPFYVLGKNKSADGIIEYRGEAFNGALKGELLITNYSVGDDITRVRLSSDGLSVVEKKQLAAGFDDPLPITQGPDGTIYVGEFGGSKVTALIPSNPGSWTTRQPLPVSLLDAGGTVINGKLYVVGGKTSSGGHQTKLYIYDPITDSWTTGQDMPGPGVENPGVAAYNGKMYVFGGSTDPFSGAVNFSYMYNPNTNTWSTIASMPTARGGAGAQQINGKIYVVGGMDSNGASLATLEIYDPATNTWSTGAPMSTRRDNPGTATLGGKLYVFGGRTRNADGSTPANILASAEVYDPATNTWAAIAPMPTARRTMVTGILKGRIQVMGGEITSTGGAFPQNEEYDPATNTWLTLTPMLTPRHGAVAGTINNTIYVAGGGPQGGAAFTNVNEAFAFNTINTNVDTSINAGPTGIVANSSATFSFSSNDPSATFECRLDGAPFTACSSPVTLSGLADGSHTFEVRAISPTNGTDQTPAGRTWVVDTTRPQVASTSPAHGTTDVPVTTNVQAVFSEPMDPVTINANSFYLVKEGTTTHLSATVSYDQANARATLVPASNLKEGAIYTATIMATVKDMAGNSLAANYSWSFTVTSVDNTPPETTITAGPTGLTNQTSATFQFTSSEDNSSFLCSLDGSPFSPCSSPVAYSGLQDGSHTFQVKAVDQAGNQDPSPASRAWIIDATPPTITGTTPVDGPNGVAVHTNVVISFSEALAPGSVQDTSVYLTKQGETNKVQGTLSYDNDSFKVTLDPTANLEPNTTYVVTVKGGAGGITDAIGNPLATDRTWSFTTASATAFVPIRVDSGNTSSYTDTGGNVWSADTGYTGGSVTKGTTSDIAGTNDDRLYQKGRSGAPFSYRFQVPNGTYTVRLKFAETYWTRAGQRVFNVNIEGSRVLSNFDILQTVAPKTALDRTFKVEVSDGRLDVDLTSVVNYPLVSALEITE